MFKFLYSSEIHYYQKFYNSGKLLFFRPHFEFCFCQKMKIRKATLKKYLLGLFASIKDTLIQI